MTSSRVQPESGAPLPSGANTERWQVLLLAFCLLCGGLRLWAIAGGRMDQAGYVLVTADDPVHHAAGAQLARLGLAAVSLSSRGGPGWRITSARRLRRLAELLGEPPDGAGPDWPG